MTLKQLASSALLASLLFCASSAVAIPHSSSSVSEHEDGNISMPQCNTLLKECFNSTGIDRSNCFFSSAEHPFCKGTEISKLANQRFGLSEMRLRGDSAAPGFLGPMVVDKQCVTTFDNMLKLELEMKKKLNIEKLKSQLDSCMKDLSRNLSQP